jgi:hypothetical protein
MKAKLYAAGVHLLISFVMATLAALLVFFVWYPAPLQKAVGVGDVFWMMLGIDVVLGPLLTFVVFKQGKKTLKLDLSVIAILQICALMYGLYTVYIGKPAYIVFAQDTFDVVRVINLDAESADKTPKIIGAFEGMPWLSPKWVGAKAPQDKKQAQAIMLKALAGGADWPQMPETYVPLASLHDEIKKQAKPLDKLLNIKQDAGVDTLAVLEMIKTKYENLTLGWLPLRANTQSMVVVVNANSGEALEVIDLSPW